MPGWDVGDPNPTELGGIYLETQLKNGNRTIFGTLWSLVPAIFGLAIPSRGNAAETRHARSFSVAILPPNLSRPSPQEVAMPWFGWLVVMALSRGVVQLLRRLIDPAIGGLPRWSVPSVHEAAQLPSAGWPVSIPTTTKSAESLGFAALCGGFGFGRCTFERLPFMSSKDEAINLLSFGKSSVCLAPNVQRLNVIQMAEAFAG